MLKCIYADTDSVMIAGVKTEEDGYKIETCINKCVKKYIEKEGVKDNRLNFEFEEYIERGIWVAKKRYACKKFNGSYKIMGFQMVRSDTQSLTKKVQETILHDILSGTSNKEIRDYYYNIKDGVLKGEYNSEIGIPRKFTKELDKYANSTAVRGASYSNNVFNTNIGAGDKCLIYHIKHTGSSEPTDAIALTDDMTIPEGYTIDIKKHWERIDKALLPVLNDLDILEKEKQTGLDAFLF